MYHTLDTIQYGLCPLATSTVPLYNTCSHIVLSMFIQNNMLFYDMFCYALPLIIYLLCYTLLCYAMYNTYLVFFTEHPDRRRSERRLFLPQSFKDVHPLYSPGQRLYLADQRLSGYHGRLHGLCVRQVRYDKWMTMFWIREHFSQIFWVTITDRSKALNKSVEYCESTGS